MTYIVTERGRERERERRELAGKLHCNTFVWQVERVKPLVTKWCNPFRKHLQLKNNNNNNIVNLLRQGKVK